jgi:hypothetical protein
MFLWVFRILKRAVFGDVLIFFGEFFWGYFDIFCGMFFWEHFSRVFGEHFFQDFWKVFVLKIFLL